MERPVLLIESYRMQHAPDGRGDRVGPVVIAGTGPEVLFEALRPGVAMAVWGRRAMPVPLTEFARLPAGPVFDVMAEGAYEGLGESLFRQVPCALPKLLQFDIDSLAAMFAVVAMTSVLRGRLRGVQGHHDAASTPAPARLRLLCAYQGAGIECLAAPDALPGQLDLFSAAILNHANSDGYRWAPASGAARSCLVLDLEAA